MNDLPDRQRPMHGLGDGTSMRLVRDDDASTADRSEADGGTDDGRAAGASDAAFTATSGPRVERRDHRRFDIESWDVSLDRWDGRPDARVPLGKVLDLSACGVRIRTRQANIRPDQQVRVRLALPAHGAISPFVDLSGGQAKPTREWSGWLAVRRVRQVGGAFEVAGRLVDMEAMDRGMLGLYLSAQPLAA